MTPNISKLLFYFIILSGTLNNYATAQAPVIDWEKSYGGPDQEKPAHIIAASDGGYLVTGETWGEGGQVTGFHADTLPGPNSPDIWVVKIDSTGVLQWQKVLGGSAPDLPSGAIEMFDGSYIIAGATRSVDGDVTNHQYDYDFWLVKLDATGSMVWDKTFNQGWDEITCISPTNDSGFILTGSVANAAMSTWIIKFDKDGKDSWNKGMGYGGTTESAFANAVYQTADSGYILAGQAWFPGGNHDVWVAKTDTGGNKKWEKTFGGSGYDEATDVRPTDDGGYIIVGRTESSDGDITLNKGHADYWIIKTDSAGNMEWQKTYGGSQPDMANAVLIDNDGGFLVGGYTRSGNGDLSDNHGSVDAWLIKLDAAGALVWEKTYGGRNWDAINDMTMNKYGNIAIACQSTSDNGDVSYNHTPGFIKEDDFWIAQLKSSATSVGQIINKGAVAIFPNPASDYIEIAAENGTLLSEVSIVSIDGSILSRITADGHSARANVSGFAPGNYLIEVKTRDGACVTKRFVKP